MDLDLDSQDVGFQTVKKKRRHLSSSSSSSAASSIHSTSSRSFARNNSCYSLALRFNITPNLVLVSKGLRSLALNGNLNLTRLNAKLFKIVVDNPHTMNKLLLLHEKPPTEWVSLGHFNIVIQTENSSTRNSNISHTFVIKNMDLALTDEEIKEELINNGLKTTGVKRITSSLTGKLTYIVRVFTKSEEDMQKCINNGVTMFFILHHCENSHANSIQCAKCLKLGHSRQDCDENLACHKCGGAHLANACDADRRSCVLCGGDHTATFAACPAKLEFRRQNLQKQKPPSAPAKPPANAWLNGPPVVKASKTEIINSFTDTRKPVSDAFCVHGCIAETIPNIISMLVNAILNSFKSVSKDDVSTAQGFLNLLVRNFFND